MTDLTKQLEEALKPSYPNDRIRFADMSYGIQCHADRLAPLHAALLKCVEALEIYSAREFAEAHNGQALSCLMAKEIYNYGKSAREALAELREALEESK